LLTNVLAEHEFSVGYFYMRKGASSAALARFTELEQRYPEYGARDKLYFYAARVLEKLGRRQEADRYYARLTAEFPESEYARKVRGPRGEKPASAAASARPSPKSKVQSPK
jgi:outer membrane protein assembly factor BamD (BamD/ComL family)